MLSSVVFTFSQMSSHGGALMVQQRKVVWFMKCHIIGSTTVFCLSPE